MQLSKLQIQNLLLLLIAALTMASCSRARLYDDAEPGDTAVLIFENSPNITINEIIVNRNPTYPDKTVKVLSGDQDISFTYEFEDKDNLILTPPFRGSCKTGFYAKGNNSYTINTSRVWQNEAKESRFWVIQPNREEVIAVDCSKMGEKSKTIVSEKELPVESDTKAPSMWNKITESFKEKDVEPSNRY